MYSPNAYKKEIDTLSPPSPILKNTARAFLVGGGLCLFGEGLRTLYSTLTDQKSAALWVTITVILLSAILTGVGVYDRIARFAGAGTLVPVSGFANSVVSPALDTKSEGFILGVGSKIFTVAGPVILYGVLSGSLYGLILYLVRLIGRG